MSDEEDYMSDKFLAKFTDIRPSLIQDRRKKRQIKIETKKLESNKRQRGGIGGSRNERLQESLKNVIKEDNKGFQMLAKMGYKQGQALGRQTKTSTETKDTQRLTEPLGITIKEGRSGLGREAALKEFHEKRQQLKQKHLLEKLGAGESLSAEEFRRRTTARAEERFFESALRKCQTTCENLDSSANVDVPEMSWFWPERAPEIAEESAEDTTEAEELNPDTDVEYTTAEKLEMLVIYLRTAFLFCFWCGIKYDNLEDLNSNCPGLTREDH